MAKSMDIIKSEKFGPLMHSATMCYSDTLPGFAKCKGLIKYLILELFFGEFAIKFKLHYHPLFFSYIKYEKIG